MPFKLSVLAAVSVLGAVAYPLMSTLAPRPCVGPLKLSDLTMNRSIRLVVPLPPPSGNPNNPQYTITEQMPPGMGIAISEIGGIPHGGQGVGTCPVRMRLTVEGVLRASIVFPVFGEVIPRYGFDPPVVVRPNEVLTIDFLPQAGNNGPCSLNVGTDAAEFSIGGWKLEPGDA